MPERSDSHLEHVIINQKAEARERALRVEGVPFPFTSREQYERAMRKPLGREWNSKSSFLAKQPSIQARSVFVLYGVFVKKQAKCTWE